MSSYFQGMMEAEIKLKKFGQKGEKTGWTYILLDSAMAQILNPGVKTSYAVKGRIDGQAVSALSLIPMGKGEFILPFNADLRRKLKKKAGDSVRIQFQLDKSVYQLNERFLAGLEADDDAYAHFRQMPASHQKYFSKWIESAKTDHTRDERILRAVSALAKKWNYAQMIRAGKSS